MANLMINGEPVAAAVGEDLLTAARRHGAVIGFLCDGRGMCTTCQCQIVVGASELMPPNEVERAWLTDEQLGRDERLACQAQLMGEGPVVVLTGAEVLRRQLRGLVTAGPGQATAHELSNLVGGIGASALQIARHFPLNVLRTWPRFFQMPPHLPGVTKYVVDASRMVERALRPDGSESSFAGERLRQVQVEVESSGREATGPGADI